MFTYGIQFLKSNQSGFVEILSLELVERVESGYIAAYKIGDLFKQKLQIIAKPSCVKNNRIQMQN